MATKITYTQQGDYLLPDLKLPEQPKVEIGIWGKRHLRYIKNHHPIRYTNLLTSCKLTTYLADIDEEANEMFDRLVMQLSKQEGVTEKLKAENQMLWVQRMNNIRNRATEIVNAELIYNKQLRQACMEQTQDHYGYRIVRYRNSIICRDKAAIRRSILSLRAHNKRLFAAEKQMIRSVSVM